MSQTRPVLSSLLNDLSLKREIIVFDQEIAIPIQLQSVGCGFFPLNSPGPNRNDRTRRESLVEKNKDNILKSSTCKPRTKIDKNLNLK